LSLRHGHIRLESLSLEGHRLEGTLDILVVLGCYPFQEIYEVAFMPVQQASTVHLSGTITIADDAITAAKIATAAIGESELATDAITSAELEATAITEIQSLQIVLFDSADFSTAVSCTATDASFLVHYNIGNLADAEVITIGGTATTNDLVITVDVTVSTSSINTISGTVGGNTGETVTFDSDATTANIHLVIETATGATSVACA